LLYFIHVLQLHLKLEYSSLTSKVTAAFPLIRS